MGLALVRLRLSLVSSCLAPRPHCPPVRPLSAAKIALFQD